MIERKKPRLYYGYVVVAAGLVAGIFILAPFISIGVFFKPISGDLGWLRATTSVASSIAMLVQGILSIFSGRITDRYGPRVVLVAAALLIGGGNLLLSQMSELWQFYIFYGVMVGGAAVTAEIPLMATVSRWFVRKRGMMAGITKMGGGLGIMLGPLVSSLLIANYGWRDAYLYTAIICFLGIIAGTVFLRHDPADMGLLPDGDVQPPEADVSAPARGYSVRDAIGTRQFWTCSFAWLLLMFCVQVVVVHLVNHVTDMNISATIGAAVISVIGICSLVGRVGLASLGDRIGPKWAYLMAIGLLVSALVAVLLASDVWAFYIFAVIYGVAHGAFFVLMVPILAGLFGVASLGGIYGWVFFIGTLGGLAGPIAAGWIYDVTGTYRYAFLLMLVFSLVAALLMFSLRPIRENLGEVSP
ncbi:MFS transporter [Chloroflexota bacterium]